MFNEGCTVHTHWKSWVGAGDVVSSRVQESVHRPLSDIPSLSDGSRELAGELLWF